MPKQIVVITGAAGRIGGYLRPRMHRPDRLLRLVDISPVSDVADDEEAIEGSLTDRALMRRAVDGADAVVHLGGIAAEAPWSEILATNVDGTQSVLQAAADARVPRVVIASSNHAAGYWHRPVDGSALPDTIEARPDSFYGWSKAAIELLGRLYHDRFGITVVNLRMGWCSPHPDNARGAEIWLSADDVARLVEASLDPEVTGFHTVWGVSANATSWWSPAGGDAIGYRPQDDSAAYASELAPPDPDVPAALGGEFTTTPLGDRM